MSKTKIQWTDEVWNPVTGCTPVSEGCRNCYAKRMAHRLAGRYGYPKEPHEFDVTLRPERLGQPLRWRKPRRIFIASMSDLFHENVPTPFIADIWDIMAEAHQHTFQLLTKRADRLPEVFHYLAKWKNYKTPLPNFHLGVSVENQAAADERIPWLLRTPAAVRFVSYEPALGPVDLSPQHADGTVFAPLGEERFIDCGGCVGTPGSAARAGGLQPTCPGHEAGGIDWVICGGESGPGARPMHPDWARSLRDQCQAAGVPFFFKSWGAWAYDDQLLSDGLAVEQAFPSDNGPFRVGKKRTGNLLDGRTWQQFPAADGAGNR